MCSVHVSWNCGIYSIFSNPSSFQVKQQNCISLWTKTLPKAFLVARKRWSLEPTCTSNIHWLTYYQQMLWIHCLHQHQWQLPAKSQGQPLVWRNSLTKIKEKSIIYCTWACKSWDTYWLPSVKSRASEMSINSCHTFPLHPFPLFHYNITSTAWFHTKFSDLKL